MANEVWRNSSEVATQGATSEQSLTVQFEKRIRHFCCFVVSIPVVFACTVLPAFNEIESHHNILVPIWGISVLISLLAAVILIILTSFISNFPPLLTSFIFLGGSAVAASYCSLLFFVKVNAWIALIVPAQSLTLVGIIIFRGTLDNNTASTGNNTASTGNNTASTEADNKKLESCFDLSKLTIPPALATQWSLIVGYLKSSSLLRKRPSRSDLAITYLASILCLCSMMLTCMPLRFSTEKMKNFFLSTVQLLNYAMLVALAWIAMTLAAGFLDGAVVLSFTLLAIMASACFLGWHGTGGEQELQGANGASNGTKGYKDICIGVIAAGYYGILVLAYSMDPEGKRNSLFLQIVVFFLLVAIVSGLALTPFTLELHESSPILKSNMVFFFAMLIVVGCLVLAYFCIDLYKSA